MPYDDIYRIIPGTPRSVAVASVGGAQASTTALSAQTYAVRLLCPGSTSSTGGCRFDIGSTAVAVSSTQSALLVPNWPEIYKVTPGQTVAFLSNDAGTFSVNVVELSK